MTKELHYRTRGLLDYEQSWSLRFFSVRLSHEYPAAMVVAYFVELGAPMELPGPPRMELVCGNGHSWVASDDRYYDLKPWRRDYYCPECKALYLLGNRFGIWCGANESE